VLDPLRLCGRGSGRWPLHADRVPLADALHVTHYRLTYRQRHLRKRGHGARAGRTVLLLLASAIGVVLAGLLALSGYVVAVAVTSPDIAHLRPLDKGRASVIYAADGAQLGVVEPDETRTPIPWSSMPLSLRRGTVAIEDKRFYEHGGVDYQGIVRAFFADITSGHSAQGGSTITQQLVRAVYMNDPKHDLSRKIKEAKLATELEQHHSKTWILWQYLNSVPYGTYGGRTALGVEAAAQMYFNKHAKDLTLSEAALLAGLPQAPSGYDPFRNRAGALRRRDEVLRAMVQQGYLRQKAANRAMRAPLDLQRPTIQSVARREPYFLDYVQQQLVDRYGAAAFRQGGFKVYTTIDPKLQRAGKQAIQGRLFDPGDPSAAVVAIDPATGYIRAMASATNSTDRSFNLAAQARRQPGSAFKAFVLTEAIRQGVDPDTTTYESKPLILPIGGYGLWEVRTYDNTYTGATSITEATLHSDNTVFAQLDVDLGPKKVANTARLMGIDTPLEGVPSEGLGGLASGVSPLEMASAYATLASGGIRSTPEAITRVVLPDGHVETLGKPKRERVLSAGVAYEVTKLLRQNVEGGTGTNAQFGCPAAGKTGTTDHYNDAWFVGYTPDLTTAVWIGYPNALRSMNDVHGTTVTGSTIPAGIWHDFMQNAGTGCADFSVPDSLPQLRTFHGPHTIGGSAKVLDAPAGPTTTPTGPATAATGPAAGPNGTAVSGAPPTGTGVTGPSTGVTGPPTGTTAPPGAVGPGAGTTGGTRGGTTGGTGPPGARGGP